jgi:hypothetical protein
MRPRDAACYSWHAVLLCLLAAACAAPLAHAAPPPPPGASRPSTGNAMSVPRQAGLLLALMVGGVGGATASAIVVRGVLLRGARARDAAAAAAKAASEKSRAGLPPLAPKRALFCGRGARVDGRSSTVVAPLPPPLPPLSDEEGGAAQQPAPHAVVDISPPADAANETKSQLQAAPPPGRELLRTPSPTRRDGLIGAARSAGVAKR